jgi:hypothetical protein
MALSGAFALVLYLAVGEQIEPLALPVVGFVWTLFALNAAALFSGGAARHPAASFAWTVFDIAVLAALFLAGWFWTAFAYAGSCGCAQLAGARAAGRF